MKKKLIDRIKKVHCQRQVSTEIQSCFPIDKLIEYEKEKMYEAIINELKNNGLIKEEVWGSKDCRIVRMELLAIEPEKEDEND